MAAKTKPRKRPAPAKTKPRRTRARGWVIETEGLTKRFQYVVAVDHLDLQVRRGEVFGYLGPNGSGKSTTIRMLLDFIRPTSGTYRLLGGTGGDPAIRSRVGYLPGELRFDLRYSTNDVVAFYGELRGGVERSWVDELCQRFDLDPSRPLGQLSSGNRRKVAIVQAFMHQPELLVLDEPTQGLDPLLQQAFQTLIRDVVSEGATVFLSSHVLPEVEALADRAEGDDSLRGVFTGLVGEDEVFTMDCLQCSPANAEPSEAPGSPDSGEAAESDGAPAEAD